MSNNKNIRNENIRRRIILPPIHRALDNVFRAYVRGKKAVVVSKTHTYSTPASGSATGSAVPQEDQAATPTRNHFTE